MKRASDTWTFELRARVAVSVPSPAHGWAAVRRSMRARSAELGDWTTPRGTWLSRTRDLHTVSA